MAVRLSEGEYIIVHGYTTTARLVFLAYKVRSGYWSGKKWGNG